MLNLNELGFAKLKDLVLSMSDQIKLELRSHNHPFAYLIHSGKPLHSKGNSDDLCPPAQFKQTLRNPQPHLSEDLNQFKYLKDAIMRGEAPQIEPVLTAFYSLLREFPIGIDARRIPFMLSSRLGYQFDVQQLGCGSLLEFLKKFVIPTIDIEIIRNNSPEQDSFVVRSKELLR